MKKLAILSCVFFLVSGCASTPTTVVFNDKTVGTYGPSAGCGTLGLDEDCSHMSGGTRHITVDGISLRVSGGQGGKVIFVMSKPKFMPDEDAIKKGAIALEALFQENNINIMETKVMFGSGKLFGVRYLLDGDGYSILKSIEAGKNS